MLGIAPVAANHAEFHVLAVRLLFLIRASASGRDSSPKFSHKDFTSRTAAVGLLRLERSHIDGEAVLDIGLEQSVVGVVNLLDRNDFDIGSEVM